MEREETRNRPPQEPRRFSWVLLIFALSGFLMSAVFIALSFSGSGSRSDETGVTGLASDTLEAGTAISGTGSASAFTKLPLTDPGVGEAQGLGRIRVGQLSPDFTLETLDGGEITLSDFRGQAVLINFWASWCEPCRIEMPEIVRAYERYSDAGFTVLAVNLTAQDVIEDVQNFVDEFAMTFPVPLDVDDRVNTLYGLLGLPMSIFVNREGIISYIQLGAMTGTQIDKFIGEILG